MDIQSLQLGKNMSKFSLIWWFKNRILLRKHNLVREYFRNRKDIHTFTTQDELLMLSDYAAKVPADLSIVEIGSYVGASTRYILYGSRKSMPKIYCVDTWMNETMPDGDRDTFKEFGENIEPQADRIALLRSDSKALDSASLPRDIGMAFIDGDHSYEAVCHDLSIVIPNIREGGLIAFHDVSCFQGVSRCVGELLSKGEYKIKGYTNNLIVVKKDSFYG